MLKLFKNLCYKGNLTSEKLEYIESNVFKNDSCKIGFDG